MTLAALPTLQSLEPIARREAARYKRKLPASIEFDDLVQSARIAAWKALQCFDGRGSAEGFVVQQMRFGIAEFIRSSKPGGRSAPLVRMEGEDALEDLAADDNQALAAERKNQLMARLRGMPQQKRAVLMQAASGRQLTEIAKEMQVSSSRVSQIVHEALAAPQSNRVTAAFDPAAVIVKTGPLPLANKPPAQQPSRYAKLAREMPAGGFVQMAHAQARTLSRTMTMLKIKHATSKATTTTTLVIREPTSEQLAQLGRKANK